MTSENDIRPIMIVDDDAECLQVACGALVDSYPVLCISDADAALTIASEMQLSAIVLDVMMPGGRDGFTLFCDLRKLPALRQTPILMLTEVNAVTGSSFSVDALQDYLGDAPAAFLDKPVDPDLLLAEIGQFVPTQH